MAKYYIAQAYGYYSNSSLQWSKEDSYSGSSLAFANLSGASPTVGGQAGVSIYYIGIQTLPGVQFTINDNITESGATIRVGQTGIFELNLMDETPIEKLKFINLGNMLQEQDDDQNNNYCLIDVIYTYNESEE